MAGHKCCCDGSGGGGGGGGNPPDSCDDVEWCNIGTLTLELEINDWHSMSVRRFTTGGSTYCVAVEIKWDLVAELHRSFATAPDVPQFLFTGFDDPEEPCNCLVGEYRRAVDWITLNECDWSFPNCSTRECDEGLLPEHAGYPCFPHFPNSGGSWQGPNGVHRTPQIFASYIGIPARTEQWQTLVLSDGQCVPGPVNTADFAATSAPKIVGTATRKLYNLTTSTLLEDQSYNIERDVECVYACNFLKSSCVNGVNMRLVVTLLDRAPAGQRSWGVRFPPLQNLPSGGFNPNAVDYHIMFDTSTTPVRHTFGESTGSITMVAPFTSSTAVPLNIDFIERPGLNKAFCCTNFSTTDCNGGDLVCTNDPSEDFQRCHSPYGTTSNWQCYREPSLSLVAV
jgi:hypothetical protein